MKLHPEYSELLNRIENRCTQLITDDKSSLAMSIDHYTTGSEVLARLRAYQVHLQIPIESTLPHELIEIFNPEDLKWLNEAHIDLACTNINITQKIASKFTITNSRNQK